MTFLKALLDFTAKDERELKNKNLAIAHFKKYQLNSLDRKFCNNGHFTASGIVFNANKTHILLTHHKILNIWIQLGGHIDKTDKSFSKAAIRECIEESGIEQIELLNNEIFDIDIHDVPLDKSKNESAHSHYDVRYLLISKTDKFVVSNESHNLKWVEIKMIKKIPALKNIAKKIEYFI